MNLNNKRCFVHQLLMIGILAIFSQIVSAKPLNQVVFACNQSFESYAYGLPGYEISSADELNDQWQARYEIPMRNIEFGYRNPKVLFFRMNDAELEIWVFLDTRGRDGGLEYGVYNATTGEFKLVSANIDNLNLVADQLFVDFNGTVWGIVQQYADYTAETGYYPTMSDSRFFPLAYFDDNEKQFQLATGEPTFAIRKDEPYFTPNIRAIVDNNLRVFWLFDDIGIYRYDPQMQSSTFVYSFLESGVVRSVDIDSSGDIYFSRYVSQDEWNFDISHQANSLSVLMPQDNSVQSINDPPQPFPDIYNMSVDRQDNLWLGPVAYRDGETGSWEMLHPDINFALNVRNFGSIVGRRYPNIVLEDSSGRIWFSGTSEYPYGASGLAWYDPTTGYGCNTRMDATNIIEDVDGKLWFLDQGTRTLYQTVDSVASFNVSLASLEEDNHEPQ